MGGAGQIPKTFSHRMLAQEPIRTRGGRVRITDSTVFPASVTIAAALVEVEPGGLRELHWHPNGDEWQYYLSGKGRMTVFGSESKARTFDYQAGDVGYVPLAMGHYIENTGDTTLTFLENVQEPALRRRLADAMARLDPAPAGRGPSRNGSQADRCPAAGEIPGRVRLTRAGTRPDPGASTRTNNPRRSTKTAMRAASRALLALALAFPAGAARAQVQQNDPNAANASFGLQSQIRTLNQQRVTDFNTLNQSIQRQRPVPALRPLSVRPGPLPGPHVDSHVGPAYRPARDRAAGGRDRHARVHRLLSGRKRWAERGKPEKILSPPTGFAQKLSPWWRPHEHPADRLRRP